MADRPEGGALGGGRNPAGARPLGPRDVEVGQGIRDKWPLKNPNRAVPEQKVVYTGSKYRSEYTLTKTKNKELQEIFDVLLGYHVMINRSPSSDAITEVLEDYHRLMEKVGELTALIKADMGMPLPLPKKLKKSPKIKAMK